MTEQEINNLVLLIGLPLLFIGYLIYFSSDRLSKCAMCGKDLSVKAHRYWYKNDEGKDVPVCTQCHNRVSN
ncbi:hypothetical protein HMF8227_00963 [Saliniradius amylolyticus]|uniref:Uncharacterized protein n=1 Tax=Saliniradius amylolyticus TaxID=2183582 RepID=A0A2S2E1F2_9ALTE|nr:hypothetical protein HMF8227_00963 [Saliniradius amylolyticus]